jgi:HAD superfamily hydrolase (TIGR01509 family)
MKWDSRTIFLMDNDGVLVDGNQDYVWFGKIPEMLAEKKGISFKEAYDFCVNEYKKFEGTLEWYDVDFWEKRFGIEFKTHIKPPELFDDAKEFLEKFGKQTIVVTAAHFSIIDITTKNVKLYVKKVYSTFDFGLPKENPAFFYALIKKEHLIPENCVFVDDKLENVTAARKAGIKAFLLDRNSKEEKEGVINSLRKLM